MAERVVFSNSGRIRASHCNEYGAEVVDDSGATIPSGTMVGRVGTRTTWRCPFRYVTNDVTTLLVAVQCGRAWRYDGRKDEGGGRSYPFRRTLDLHLCDPPFKPMEARRLAVVQKAPDHVVNPIVPAPTTARANRAFAEGVQRSLGEGRTLGQCAATRSVNGKFNG